MVLFLKIHIHPGFWHRVKVGGFNLKSFFLKDRLLSALSIFEVYYRSTEHIL